MRMPRKHGFSLIELLISTAIGTIIGSGVLLFMVSQTKLTATQNRNMLNADQVRGVMNFMADEIEMMGNGVPEPLIAQADPQEFVFYGDIDNNGIRDRIHYFISPTSTSGRGQLKRTLSTSPDGITWTDVGTDVLIDNVITTTSANGVAFGFKYFGRNGTTPATTSQITAVQINIGLDTKSNQTNWTDLNLAHQNFVTLATIRNRAL